MMRLLVAAVVLISRATSGQRVTGENCSVTEAATLTTSSPETGSLVAGVDLVSDTAHIFTETTQTPPYCSGCRVNHDAVNDVGDSNDQGNTNNTNDLDGLSSQEEVSDQANMNNAIDQAITTDQVGPTTKREDTNQPTLHLNYSPCEENETPTTTQPPTANSSRPPNQTEVTAPPEHQPAVSAELKNQIMDILDIVRPIFEAVSVFLTLLSAYVYSLPILRCPTTLYLLALNAADAVCGLVPVVYAAWRNADSRAREREVYHYGSMFGALLVGVSCRRMVYCFTLLLNVERFFVIAFPLQARHMKIVRYPKVVIAILAVVILSYHSYLPLKYTVQESPKGTGYTLTYSNAFRQQPQIFADVANAAKILFAYIPLAACLALSIALAAALRRHAASREQLKEGRKTGEEEKGKGDGGGGGERAERQLARTIWLSSLLFALLSVPSNTLQLIASYHPHLRFRGLQHNLYTVLNGLASLSLVATRFTNFITYLGLSTTFRHSLLRLLRCKKVVPRRNGRGSRSTKEDGASSSAIYTTETSGFTMTQMSAVE